MLRLSDIRKKFLDFFKQHNHTVLPSSSLVPKNDPSLLFTNAGMVQFKRIFQGLQQPQYPTATTVQKCVRAGGKHNDLENVGRTARHHTFFEMLGNFSFGEYFKKEAITYAWEFLTNVISLPKERLYCTVFLDDDEAFNQWKVCGVQENHLFRLGEKDNFWAMGDTGPCGPCSEIFFDQGEHMSCGENCGIGSCDCDRFLEIWNLVFMQYDQQADGTRTSLPKPSIDTGIGLERMAAVCQGVYSNYDIDLFQDIIRYIVTLTDNKYEYKKINESVDTALRVIADHARAIAFLISDGVLPSNEGRGYVLRRIIRRAFRFGREIGFCEPFLYKVVHYVVTLMQNDYAELAQHDTFMQNVVKNEEQSFHNTLDKGLHLLEEYIQACEKTKAKQIRGEDAFLLYDTYGFPIDILNDVANQRGISVDSEVFSACIEKQKALARASWKGGNTTALHALFAQLTNTKPTTFCGYTQASITAGIVHLFDKAGSAVKELVEGEQGYIITESTTLYPTGGGQCNDTGTVETAHGTADIIDVEKSPADVIVHAIYVTNGVISAQDIATMQYTKQFREAVAKNHTATHLTFTALRTVLGDHIRQAGSSVTPEKLRIDFTHTAPLTQEELLLVEAQVNNAIQQAIPIIVQQLPKQEAMAQGAVSLAGEEYTDIVRVVEYPHHSKELCCGTHVENTGMIGAFFIITETGVATGIRRIEAITGNTALAYAQNLRSSIQYITDELKSSKEDILPKFTQLQEEKKQLQQELHILTQKLAQSTVQTLLAQNKNIPLVTTVPFTTTNDIKYCVDVIKQQAPNTICCFIGSNNEQLPLVIYVPQKYHIQCTAQDIFTYLQTIATAKGGGKKDMLQAVLTNITASDLVSLCEDITQYITIKIA